MLDFQKPFDEMLFRPNTLVATGVTLWVFMILYFDYKLNRILQASTAQIDLTVEPIPEDLWNKSESNITSQNLTISPPSEGLSTSGAIENSTLGVSDASSELDGITRSRCASSRRYWDSAYPKERIVGIHYHLWEHSST